jgi:LEA14-like dessication related protein
VTVIILLGDIKMVRLFLVKTGLVTMMVLAVLSLTTCETLKIFREPLLSLHSVDISKISFTGTDLLCKVRVQNPNPITIPFPEVGWELFVNTNSFINGVVKNNRNIGARGSTIIDVPVSLNYLDVFNTFRSLKGTRQADFRVALAAKFAIPVLGDKVFRFAHTGTFPVLQMPKLSMPTLRFDKMDFTKAELLFTVNVENPNSFPLPSPNLAYDYLVNNNSFVRSSMSAAPLAAGAVTAIPIKVTVNYADLYRSFQALRNSNETPSKFSLRSDFAIPAFAGDNFMTELAANLPLLKVPTISFKGITVKSPNFSNPANLVNLSKIDFGVIWEVENNNNFAMSVKNLTYNLSVNNSRWAGGNVTGSPQIAAGRKTEIPLTVSVSTLSMVRDLTEIIKNGTNVSYLCGGNINLGAALPGLDDFGTPFNFSGNTRLRN